MSWSISFIGAPEKVAKALENQSSIITGPSKTEFDAALPHLLGLVGQNSGPQPPVIKLDANGSGYKGTDGVQYSSCQVSIQQIYGLLV